jgi:hypothetical protein
MSLCGEHTAFISIGLGCQTSWQLHVNSELLSALTGDRLCYRSAFFNWVIVSSDSIPRVLERLVLGGAIRMASLRIPKSYQQCNTLAGHKVWFWHEKPSHTITPDLAVQMAGKYEHLRQNFLDLCSRPCRYFVLSSAQNNLEDEHPYRCEGMQIALDDTLLRNIRRTLDQLLPSGENHLIVVVRRDRIARGMRERTCPIEGDDTEWRGVPALWHEMLKQRLEQRERPERLGPFRIAIG